MDYNTEYKKGESLVAVIIAMAVVLLLGMGALYVTRNNYKMKVLDRDSAENFYSAESLVEDISVGLQKIMSSVYTESYTNVMENYRSYAGITDMKDAFNTEFVLALVNSLDDSENQEALSKSITGTATYLYSKELIISFIDASKYTDATWTVDFTDNNGATPYDNILDTLEDGVALRNIHVTYLSNMGFFDEIYTDIKMNVPDLSFSMISTMPDIAEYALVADSGVIVNDGIALDVTGNLYAGSGSDGISIEIKNSGRMDLTKSPLAVSESTILVGRYGRLETGGGNNTDEDSDKTNTSLWTTDIVFKESSYGSLLGRTYVKDDTTISGDTVVLNIGGQYFGYSNGTKRAVDSSAIIINGKNSTLNISALNTLILAGTSFVGTSKIESDQTNYDILMGDSIAVKSNQLAYMVPAECEGVKSNPMSYTQYNQLKSDPDWTDKILNTTLSSINRTIASYGEVSVVPVFSARDDGTVYLYVNFATVSAASNFFMDVYNSDSGTGSKIREYIETYLPDFQLNTATSQIITEGNYLIPGYRDSVTGEIVGITYRTSSYSSGSIPALMSNTLSSYTALCKKLVSTKSSLSAEELSDDATVFTNLISEDAIDYFFSLGSIRNGATVTTENGYKAAIFDTGAEMKGIIVDNEGADDYVVDIHGGTGVIIATGNVKVAGSFTGIIIAKGKITVISGSKINPAKLTADKTVTGKTLRMSCQAGSGQSFSFINFFKGGENYSLSETTGDSYVDMADVRNCIGFINWRTE